MQSLTKEPSLAVFSFVTVLFVLFRKSLQTQGHKDILLSRLLNTGFTLRVSVVRRLRGLCAVPCCVPGSQPFPRGAAASCSLCFWTRSVSAECRRLRP